MLVEAIVLWSIAETVIPPTADAVEFSIFADVTLVPRLSATIGAKLTALDFISEIDVVNDALLILESRTFLLVAKTSNVPPEEI